MNRLNQFKTSYSISFSAGRFHLLFLEMNRPFAIDVKVAQPERGSHIGPTQRPAVDTHRFSTVVCIAPIHFQILGFVSIFAEKYDGCRGKGRHLTLHVRLKPWAETMGMMVLARAAIANENESFIIVLGAMLEGGG